LSPLCPREGKKKRKKKKKKKKMEKEKNTQRATDTAKLKEEQQHWRTGHLQFIYFLANFFFRSCWGYPYTNSVSYTAA
jgi:hypothetical protein